MFKNILDGSDDMETERNTVAEKMDMVNCSGCSACCSVCPKNAIEMITDKEGFLKPSVDNDKCINCGLCVKRCTYLNPQYTNDPDPKCYAVMAEDRISYKSSSGGMFSVIAEYIIEQGGYVCGAALRDDFSVEHIIVDNKKDLDKLRGSKYMQSYTGDIYREIKKLLDKGKLVLFSGTPCQNAALYACVGKKYDNLYSIDILCHGIPSYKVFKKYWNDIYDGKPIKRLNFRDKENRGWSSGVSIEFEDGTKSYVTARNDPYFMAFLTVNSDCTSCGNCLYSRLPRAGDFTLGDFWGIKNTDREMWGKMGTSVVLLNNEKAEKLFETLKPALYKCKLEKTEDAAKSNGIIIKSHILSKNRNLFFDKLDNTDFGYLAYGARYHMLYDLVFAEETRRFSDTDKELYLLAKAASENHGNRKIAIWVSNPRFEMILKKYFGLEADCILTSIPRQKADPNFTDVELMEGKSDEYYIVAVNKDHADTMTDRLTRYGFTEIKDFILRNHQPVILENLELMDSDYFDVYGNTVEGYRNIIGSVQFNGFNNHIRIDEHAVRTKNLSITLDSNAIVVIGKKCSFGGKCSITSEGMKGKSRVIIGDDCELNSSDIGVMAHSNTSSITIGENCTFGENLILTALEGKRIVIGADCTFSENVSAICADSTFVGDTISLFDLETGEKEKRKVRDSIYIGEHVRMGSDCSVVGGAVIGVGSVVENGSVLQEEFPNNCYIGGHPAAVLKKNIAWKSNVVVKDMSSLSQEYAVLTGKAALPVVGSEVLVVGASDLVGTAIVSGLLASGNNVTVADIGDHVYFGAEVKKVRFDISDPKSMLRALRGKSFDVVIDNTAADPANVNSIIDNVECKRYIQISSSAVYASQNKKGIKETDFAPDEALEIFSADSIFDGGETDEIVRNRILSETNAAASSGDMSVVIVRVPYLFTKAEVAYLCNGVGFQTFIDADYISQELSVIDEKELVRFILWAAHQDFSGTVNIAFKNTISIGEVIKQAEAIISQKAIISPDERPEFSLAGRLSSPHVYETNTLDISKAEELGYNTLDVNRWLEPLVKSYSSPYLTDES